MHELTQLIKEDMRPALGVTEPGAIAYAVSKAKSYVPGELEQVTLLLNSGMYKNAYTCGIPNSHFYGNEYAAALGAVAGKPEKELESLANVTEADNVAAEQLVKDGKIVVKMSEITSRIFIEARVKTTGGEAMVRIRDAHTNIVRIEANGEVLLEKEEASVEGGHEEKPLIHNYTLKQIYEYAKEVPAEEIEFIKAAYDMNYALFEEGIQNPRTTYARYLLEKNGGKIISVGTTSTRTLETIGDENGMVRAQSGWTNIFIYPGYEFKVVDKLITNFHLPESTLIMLVSALAGKEKVMNAYNEAVKEKYRFFSFGDSMIIK